MSKKDFTVNAANRVSSAISEATAENVRKDRKTYSEEEQQAFMNALSTSGRKGVKLPRINVAVTPDVNDYMHAMSIANGMTLSQFFSVIVAAHQAEHAAEYAEIKERRSKM